MLNRYFNEITALQIRENTSEEMVSTTSAMLLSGSSPVVPVEVTTMRSYISVELQARIQCRICGTCAVLAGIELREKQPTLALAKHTEVVVK